MYTCVHICIYIYIYCRNLPETRQLGGKLAVLQDLKYTIVARPGARKHSKTKQIDAKTLTETMPKASKTRQLEGKLAILGGKTRQLEGKLAVLEGLGYGESKIHSLKRATRSNILTFGPPFWSQKSLKIGSGEGPAADQILYPKLNEF